MIYSIFNVLRNISYILKQRYSLLLIPKETCTSDNLDMNILKSEIDKLCSQYDKYMKTTFEYYDTVRFISIDLIYSVFKDIKRSVNTNEFDYIILMGLQSYVSEQTLGSSFIYRDDSFGKELELILSECSHLWDNEKGELMGMDFDSYQPWKSIFKRNEYNKAIRVSAVFSIYIKTGYYVKNTIQFLNTILQLYYKSYISDVVFLEKYIYDALFVVIETAKKRMIISKNALTFHIERLQYNINTQRLKWGFYSFINYDNCNTLTDPSNTNKMDYYKRKFDIKVYPKSIIDSTMCDNTANKGHKKMSKLSPKRRFTISLPGIKSQNISTAPVIAELVSDMTPFSSNIKASCMIIKDLIDYCNMFRQYSKQSIPVTGVQAYMETASKEKHNNKRLIGTLFSFIDIFLPFATAKKTYDVISNLTSVNSEHSKLTLLILHKWHNPDILHENENINLKYLFNGTSHDIAYKITKMNLIYYEESYILQSYYDFV